MYYSAQIRAEFRKYEREFGATLSISQYVRFFWERRKSGGWRKIAKAMKAAFADPHTEGEREIAAIIAEGDAEYERALEAELFQQKTRLTNAERSLESRPTRKAANDQRIATAKIAAARRNLDDLRRGELLPRDSRIYPGQYAPVMIAKDGKKLLVPMRYQCRLPGWTEAVNANTPARTTLAGTVWNRRGRSCSAITTA